MVVGVKAKAEQGVIGAATHVDDGDGRDKLEKSKSRKSARRGMTKRIDGIAHQASAIDVQNSLDLPAALNRRYCRAE